MPKYVWTAKDRSGKQVVKQIIHETAEGSKALLLADGCSELKLIQDEVMAAAVENFSSEKCRLLGKEIEATAERRVEAINKPPPTVFRVLWEGLGQSKGLSLLVILLSAYQAYRGNTIAALILLAALLVWILFIICVGLPGIYYGKLHKAADWNRWSEVLALVETLRKLRKIHFIKVPLSELTRFRAKALAGLGHLATALEEFKTCENQPGVPSWLYKAFAAGIYDTAKQYDKGLELLSQAIQENQSSALYLDLANRMVRYHRDRIKAKEALARAESSTISEIAKPYHLRCRGLLAYAEGDFVAAKREFEASLQLMLKTPHQPFRDGHISIVRAYLCCVLAKLNDRPAAHKCFEQAKEYLTATSEDDLIAECQKVLGV
ncbi:MAG TPA: hypothetical protein VNU68_30550 [Verrucomicrobiae bacterium]|nr:hypothetical protein [Verrucomicrobiae bacterium]